MELQVEIDAHVKEWLKSMGYPVAGMPTEILHGMLLREARQWQITPEALCELIEEGFAMQRASRSKAWSPRRTELHLIEQQPAAMFT